MKKRIGVLGILLFVLLMTGCSDEYASVMQDRVEEGQEFTQITLESDHLIRTYMVSEDGLAAKIVQILEFAYENEPYQVLIEVDPIEESFLGFENLTGTDGESIQKWQQELIGFSVSEKVPVLDGSDLESLWTSMVKEAQANYLLLVKSE
ncbi:hypothetical protein SANA_07410 [Gottschalkiaceae bacterium SANA]|nr:hypothetical protein SANA_07410 [Gottschalkiaceae bacterium SANA]